MTIENLKQIAIKYATTKGSRVPLAPDELCNAVVQYMNSFFGVMTDINTIKVAVTEDSGNIVFTITGNTYDGKPITPIVITVDHNDFVTDQEFEEFKTNILDSINSLNNSITEINNTIKNINDTLENNTTDITGLKNRVDNTETNIAEINSTLDNKLDKNTSETLFAQAYIKLANGSQGFVDVSPSSSAYSIPQRTNIGRIYSEKGAADDPSSVANMSNIADVEAKIPSITNLADVTKENTFTDVNHFTQYITTFGVEIGALEFNDDEYDVSISNATIEIFHYISGGNANSIRITDEQIWVKRYNVSDYNSFNFPNKSGTLALTSDIPDIPEYTNVNSVSYDSTNGAIVAYDGANEIHIPLLAGENVTIDASEDNKKIVISAAGGGGAGNEPIYFISFYANEPSEPCHLIGTMMSKNLYGTGQKTNEEFAVMLADNFYTNSNEGLAAYGKLANKDILCIYSEDGLSIRCLDEANSEVDLPSVIFFVMETEL